MAYSEKEQGEKKIRMFTRRRQNLKRTLIYGSNMTGLGGACWPQSRVIKVNAFRN